MQDATFVPVRFDPGTYRRGDITLPGIDAVAMRDTSGKLWLALVNLDPETPKDIAVAAAGLGVRRAAGEVLTAANVNTINTFAAPDAVVSTLAALSASTPSGMRTSRNQTHP